MQPLYFLITTAGNDTNSICYEVHQKAKDIEAGRKVDPTFYSVIYGADESEDWTDPEVWKKANPSLGYTFSIDKLAEACESARQNPSEENVFKTLRLNIWVNQAVRWMPMSKWDACAVPSFSPEDLRGRPCYGGLDLSSTTDLTALVLVFPPITGGEPYKVLPFAWIPAEAVEQRSRRDHVNYSLWAKQGFIHTTEGNVVDYDFIEAFILRLAEQYAIREIAYDRWNSQSLVTHLTDEGLTMVPFGQGFISMSAPTKELMRLTLENRLAHNGHPVLRWCMNNVVVKVDPSENIKIDKGKATERVDCAVALVMALDRTIRNEAAAQSVYESRGLLFI
jgi:phage terminase large subunit-like protein